MTTLEERGFEQIFASEYGAGYVNTNTKAVVLVATSDYIPISHFKQLLEMLGDEVGNIASRAAFSRR